MYVNEFLWMNMYILFPLIYLISVLGCCCYSLFPPCMKITNIDEYQDKLCENK